MSKKEIVGETDESGHFAFIIPSGDAVKIRYYIPRVISLYPETLLAGNQPHMLKFVTPKTAAEYDMELNQFREQVEKQMEIFRALTDQHGSP